MALVAPGELPELDAAGGGSGRGGRAGGGAVGAPLGKEPGFLGGGAAVRRVIGAVHDSGVGVSECAN